MAAKITITGMPVGNIVKTAEYFRFEMEEGGSPAPPKGLPGASVMTFSVFVATKAGKKLGFPRKPAHRLLVQGELVADLPLSECPGEMGVIAFKVEEILPKETAVPDDPSGVPAPMRPEVAPRQPTAESWPDLSTYPVVPLEQVRVPAWLRKAPLNVNKTTALQEQVREYGQLDKPLIVERTGEPPEYWLKDGYRRYVIAQQLGWTSVPVRIEETRAESLPKDARTPEGEPIVPAPLGRHKPSPRQAAESWPDLSAYPVVPLEQIAIPEEFQRTPPNAQRTAEVQAQVEKWGQLDEPVVVRRTEGSPGYLLTDGYRRYLIARQLGWATVPVRIEPDAAGIKNPPA